MLDLRYVGGVREFFATEDLATARRREVLKNVRAHGAVALALPYSKLAEYAAIDAEARDIGADLRTILAFYKSHNKATEPVLFSSAITLFHDVKSKAKKDSEYVQKLKNTLDSLMNSTGDKLLSLVTRSEIEKWLYRDGWQPDTIRSHRINIRTFFKYAKGWHWIGSNPAEHLEKVERTNKPPGILTVDECASLLAKCPKWFLPYIVLNLLCGIRTEECVNLLPENIQLDRGYVEVPAFRGDTAIAKSRKRRLVYISENAKAWLAKCDLENLVTRKGKWFNRQLPKVRQAAGLKHWPKNCLRHSFASYHLAMHGSADKTARQMGHRSTDMLFEHYCEVVTRTEAEKFWNIMPKSD